MVGGWKLNWNRVHQRWWLKIKLKYSKLGVWSSLPRNWLLWRNDPEDSGEIGFQTNSAQHDFSLGNPGNQHERNPIGCLGRGGCVRHGRHDGAQLHAQHQDDLRQAVQCQLCQHHPKSQSQFFYIILYGLHMSDIKCTMVDHREGGKGHLRGRTSLHHVHSCSLGNHRKVWLLFFYLVLKHL